MSEKRGTNWKLIVFISGTLVAFYVFLLVGNLFTGNTSETSVPSPAVPAAVKKSECEKTAIVHSAEWWSKELGRPVSSVVSSFKINLWSKPDERGKGRFIGKMMPGSHAKIFDETESSYLIKSPLDSSIGWVSKMQFEGTAYQDSITREPCTP